MMTGERVGVGHDPSRGAAYVEGWVAALEEDPREIRRAAADAQKISDFVLARSRERRGRARAHSGGCHSGSRPAARRKAGAPAAAPDPELRPEPLRPRTEP